MRASHSLIAVVIMLGATAPSFADAKKGKLHPQTGSNDSSWNCPPGLAKKNPPCVPPGQARKQAEIYGYRVGDILRIGDYLPIRDPWTYGLDARPAWEYYRDDRQIYRIDSATRRVLAVLELIEAFSN